MVIDTSALLALFFKESHSLWVKEQLILHQASLRMSTVNLAETLILIQDRQPQIFEEIHGTLVSSNIRFVPPSVAHAEMAASARLKYPLNLGDCFAYALAKEEGCPILTLDKDFKTTDVPVLFHS